MILFEVEGNGGHEHALTLWEGKVTHLGVFNSSMGVNFSSIKYSNKIHKDIKSCLSISDLIYFLAQRMQRFTANQFLALILGKSNKSSIELRSVKNVIICAIDGKTIHSEEFIAYLIQVIVLI